VPQPDPIAEDVRARVLKRAPFASGVADLDRVLAQALLLWDADTTVTWIESPNGFLGGARPIDVLAVRGSDEVLDALDAAISGTYA
jgi:uncharacterized protein (DUF2384 family)